MPALLLSGTLTASSCWHCISLCQRSREDKEMRIVADHDLSCAFAIEGLRFEANSCLKLTGPTCWFSCKLMSSAGPLISDFVTHEERFAYSSYGIHIGQDDRLTFMGDSSGPIIGYFVDCRVDSPSRGVQVIAEFSPSLLRHLIIPRGVAHTFDNLERIVTRDEPVWHSDDENPDWNVDNDLVSVDRSVPLAKFPIVRPNPYRLPDQAHVFISRLSQSLLETPRAYMARYKLTIGGLERYVMFEPIEWAQDDNEVATLTSITLPGGVKASRARYAATGSRSWTLVPSTDSCVADVLLLEASPLGSEHFYHLRTQKVYTFLTEGVTVTMSIVDCRSNSANYGKQTVINFTADPRITFTIDQGIAYRFSASTTVLVRCEHNVFADQHEPREDIPMFGNDILVHTLGDSVPHVALPSLKCPGVIVYQLAKYETNNHSEFSGQLV